MTAAGGWSWGLLSFNRVLHHRSVKPHHKIPNSPLKILKFRLITFNKTNTFAFILCILFLLRANKILFISTVLSASLSLIPGFYFVTFAIFAQTLDTYVCNAE